MSWKSIDDVRAIVSQYKNLDKLHRIYAFSLFVEFAFYSKDYEPVDTWGDAVVLSPAGERILQHLDAEGVKYRLSLLKFVIFFTFYHNDIFIDYEKTDDKLIYSLLVEMHQSGKVFWPYVYGNTLYHKYNDSYFEKETDLLNASSVDSLLKNTPQGVFQIGSLLSGPLGFTFSEENRGLYPKLSLNLWHCSDPGCLHPHRVVFQQYDTTIQLAKLTITRSIIDNFGPPSKWHRPLLEIDNKAEPKSRQPYIDLPAILSDCIIGADRISLCLRALRSPYYKMMQKVLLDTKSLSGSPEQIISKLTPEEQHQLLLLIPDKDIINYIDELVSNKIIKIPPSELRKTKTFDYTYSDLKSELSESHLVF